MDCVNHSGVNAAAYCQNCGKALCVQCTRTAPAGQVFCEPCWMAWQSVQRPFVPPPVGAPSPVLAAILGLIPGVGAMYNGQFIKGLVHVFIFAVLVSACHVYGLFGLFIAAWVFYQVFEAYYTAKARRDGDPLPDPLGLNEVGNWFMANVRSQPGPHPGAGVGPTAAGQPGPQQASATQASYQSPYQGPYDPDPYRQGASQQGDWQTPYQGYQSAGYQGAGHQGSGAAWVTPPGVPGAAPVPPIPPVPPAHWRRREPIGAVILIALGVLFLLGQFDWFSGRVFALGLPLILIGLGVWLVVRRLLESRGEPQGGPR